MLVFALHNADLTASPGHQRRSRQRPRQRPGPEPDGT